MMPNLPQGQWRSFTTTYGRRVLTLTTGVGIGAAFDPATSSGDQPLEFTAIWDTGAECTVITEGVAGQLGLQPTGMQIGIGVDGEFESYTYLISLFLPNKVCLPQVRAMSGDFAGGDVLIGMVLSYRFPSKERIDFVREDQSPARATPTVPPNKRCPCGSGKKYKNCCMT